MQSRFRLKLFGIMLCFALLISTSMAATGYYRLKEQVRQENQYQVEKIEEMVKYSLETTEKAYHLLANEIEAKMKAHAETLLEMYGEAPSFENWDFQRLKEKLGADIYIINEENVIIHSSFPADIGLDFNLCCPKLAPVLNHLRKTGGQLFDGLDIEQETGKVKKYSYTATPDNKYLIQLGYDVEEEALFQQFNFLDVIDELVRTYLFIHQINVLNAGGYMLGGDAVGERRGLGHPVQRVEHLHLSQVDGSADLPRFSRQLDRLEEPGRL